MADQARQFDCRPVGILIVHRLRPVVLAFAFTAAHGAVVHTASQAAAQTQVAEDSSAAVDTVRVTNGGAPVVVDSTVIAGDSTGVPTKSYYQPMHRACDPARRTCDHALAGAPWPMPSPDQAVAGDLADWLLLHPAYDVDDAPGAGQMRAFTHWGLADHVGTWRVDGRPLTWQRVTFPQLPSFDAGIVPSFAFSQYWVADHVLLVRDTLWGPTPRSSYFARQGDFAETYSQAQIRYTAREQYGLDLGFAFFGSDGRFAADNRDLRHLHLQLGGPLSGGRFWSYRYTQFRDKTTVLAPTPLDGVHPRRDDLLWQMEATAYRPAGERPAWMAGILVQSGKQKLSDPLQGYRIKSRDRLWSLWANSSLAGWFVDGALSWEELLVDSIAPSRWGLSLAAARQWQMGGPGRFTLKAELTDWDTDPFAMAALAVLAPDTAGTSLLPTVRLERARTVPTLFDRRRPLAEYAFVTGGTAGLLYSEQGDPNLEAQWSNAVSLRWGGIHPPDGSGTRLALEAHCAYVEHYWRWEGQETADTILGAPVTRHLYRPTAEDARVAGVGVGADGPLFAKLHYAVNYSAKYAETLARRRLTGYYPHKGSVTICWVAPHWRYGADLRLAATGIWWHGDRRIDPTGYASPHAFRLDLSGTATIKDFTFYAQMQNVAGFPYRTQAGYPFTGRTLRFGIDWHFLD